MSRAADSRDLGEMDNMDRIFSILRTLQKCQEVVESKKNI